MSDPMFLINGCAEMCRHCKVRGCLNCDGSLHKLYGLPLQFKKGVAITFAVHFSILNCFW
jgi:hypothetical protein